MMKVAGYIERKSMLYQTGVEYGDYTINHVLGCSHGCKYPCYAFLLKKRFGQVKTYEEWCCPFLVSNTLELLDKEVPRLKEQDTVGPVVFYDRSVYVRLSGNSKNEPWRYTQIECG